MNKARKINVLWFDDDLRPRDEGETEERVRLQPWLRWFHENSEQFKLIEAHTLQNFANELKNRATAETGDVNHLDILLIDVMWRESRELPKTFECIGFEDESVIPMEAGIQLAGLILKDKAPNWLTSYANRKLVVLTTLTDARSATNDYLPPHNTVTVIYKKLKYDNDGQYKPSDDFIDLFLKYKPDTDNV